MSQIGGRYGSRYFGNEEGLVLQSRLVALSNAKK